MKALPLVCYPVRTSSMYSPSKELNVMLVFIQSVGTV